MSTSPTSLRKKLFHVSLCIFSQCITITSTEETLKVSERNFCQEISETATRGVLCKKVFLEILQNSQKNTCARASFFNKVADLSPATLFKKELLRGWFPVNFVKFVRTPFLQNTSGRLLLKYKQKAMSLVIYLFNYGSSKSTFFIYWIWHLTLSWIRFLSKLLEFFVSWHTKSTRTSFF